ncbi:MAG: alpha/beta hydrolase [bacterium]
MTQIAVDQQIWNYQEIGGGKETPILILHGWGRSGEEWVPIGKELAKRSQRKIYVLDLPGFGGSSMPEVKSIEEYTELVVQFCRYMDIEKVTIVCHSLGARVGIVWTSGKNKRMVEKLILVDPVGPKEFSVKRMCFALLAGIFRFVPERIRRNLIISFLDEDYRQMPKLRKLYRVVVAEDLQSRLFLIKSPVKLIWGEQDKIVPIRMVKVYRKYVSDLEVRIVWEAGHDPHLTHPRELLRILEEIWI